MRPIKKLKLTEEPAVLTPQSKIFYNIKIREL
jgi:hypothetical protein